MRGTLPLFPPYVFILPLYEIWGFDGSENLKSVLVRGHQRFKGTYRLHLQEMYA